jgi:type I restriction enzyme, S subunit
VSAVSDFDTITIEEATDRLIDYRGKTPPKTDSGVRLITAKVVKGGQILDEPAEFIAADFYNEWMRRGLPQKLDVLLTTEAPLGEVAVLRDSERIALAQRIILLRAKAGLVDPLFLFYALQSDFGQGELKARASGTTVLGIKQSELRKVRVPMFPLPVQRRIAGILSAYDELMENSHRRIRILEAMARALYREWFVHFRFPGHETHPRVASPLGDIPKGWEVKTVADSFEISGGGTPSRKEPEYWEDGTIQWFAPSDLTGAGTMFMDDSSDHITELGLAKSSARLFPARSIMLTSRATIGAIAINTHDACTNQGFITCIPNERVPLQFLFQWVTQNVPTFQRMASGATFKEISRGVFKTIEFIHPPEKLVRRFEDSVAPMVEQILTLQRQIQNLRRTRDLLLPRLLSGQVRLTNKSAV